MGDVGALAHRRRPSACVAVIVRQELVALLMGGVFVLETASVILQVASFKLTGKRIFRMAPIHHHFELKGWAEPKVIVRFWIISLLLVLAGPRDPEAAMSAVPDNAAARGHRRPRAHRALLRALPARARLAARASPTRARSRRSCPRCARSMRRSRCASAASMRACSTGAVCVVASPGVSLAEPVLRRGAALAASRSSATSSCSRAPRTPRWSASPAPTARAP